MRNETGRQVVFERVQTGCSCGAGTKLDTMQLAPGEATTLHFDVDLRNRSGPQRFNCNLIEKDGNRWTYAVETTLYERARFDGAGAIHFGAIDPNAWEEREFAFSAYAESMARLPENVTFTSGSDQVEVEAGTGAVEELEGGFVVRKFPLKLRLKGPATPGFGQAGIHAQFRLGGEERHVQGSADWNVRTFFSITPSQVYFGQVDATASVVERRVAIRRTDGQTLAVEHVKVSCPGVRCSVEKTGEGAESCLLFVLDATLFKTALVGEAIIKTDHPTQPLVTIPVAALRKPPG